MSDEKLIHEGRNPGTCTVHEFTLRKLADRVEELNAELEQERSRTNGACHQIGVMKEHLDRMESLLERAMAIITAAIMHGMPITEEVAAVRNAIVMRSERPAPEPPR